MRFKKKPVIINAVKWDGDATTANNFIGESFGSDWNYGPNNTLIIPTLEGDMTAQIGDWIIRGVKGEFYPCKPDIFDATYELVND